MSLTRLSQMLRPAGGGIHTVSTGSEVQREVQSRLYGVEGADAVESAWRAQLDRLAEAEVVVLGVPSDVGAGFARGASFGPQHIRLALLEEDGRYRDPRVVDLGDVRVVPQLLEDEMLSSAQLARSRAALYGDASSSLPVAPLSITKAALQIARALAPKAAPLVLGGDHSVAWPAFEVVAEGRADKLGCLHFDAHTDLLAERLGIEHCFATWAYHANELMGRGGRLYQVGLRASAKTKAHWEGSLDVVQRWASEVEGVDAEQLADEVIAHFQARGVEGVYISNDIDGTDPAFGAATGTPEPGGLHPDLVETLIDRVGSAFEVWGTDLVEVAPPLAHEDPEEPGRTLRTAARFVEAQLKVSLR